MGEGRMEHLIIRGNISNGIGYSGLLGKLDARAAEGWNTIHIHVQDYWDVGYFMVRWIEEEEDDKD